ncbi:MAG: hypothetical protein AAGF94_13540 [Pseudomonadota bacterium]
MEAILFFLIKSAGGGVVGWYVKKLLERVDAEIAEMIIQKRPVSEIKKKIEEKQVGDQIEGVFKEAVDDSELLPIGGLAAKRPADKVALLATLCRFAWEMAVKERMDIMLKGSPFGSDSISVFRMYRSVDDLSLINMNTDNNRLGGWAFAKIATGQELFVIPGLSSVKTQELFDRYLDKVADERERGRTQIDLKNFFKSEIDGFEYFEVSNLGARSLVYDIYGKVLSDRLGDLNEGREGNGGLRIKYEDFVGGLSTMVSGIPAIREIDYLSEAEALELENLTKVVAKALTSSLEV